MTYDIDDYLIELRLARRSNNTITLRTIQLNGWVRWLQAREVEPRDATRGHVVHYLARWSNAETAASNRAALRGWYRWMVETERIQRDPTLRVPPIRKPQAQHRVIPDDLVLERLATAGDALTAAIVLGRFAGLRASEIAGAHRGYLRDGLDGPVVRLCGKGDRWRELPAHPEVERVLRSRSGWLFPDAHGHPVTGHRMSQILSEALPGDWTAHSLRHAFGTEAYARTRDLRLVQEWMGHALVTTTTRYVQIQHDHQAMSLLRLAA